MTTAPERGAPAQSRSLRHRWTAGLMAANTRWHRLWLGLFMVVVIGHWAEHIAQALQIYVGGWPRPEANGVLGLVWPWLITSELMHYGYAVVMLVGLAALRQGFGSSSRSWWSAALYLQAWHHVEHFLLLVQSSTGSFLLDAGVPTSIAQLIVPRVELHLFYNAVVFAPMVVAVVLHMRRAQPTQRPLGCTCGIGSR